MKHTIQIIESFAADLLWQQDELYVATQRNYEKALAVWSPVLDYVFDYRDENPSRVGEIDVLPDGEVEINLLSPKLRVLLVRGKWSGFAIVMENRRRYPLKPSHSATEVHRLIPGIVDVLASHHNSAELYQG